MAATNPETWCGLSEKLAHLIVDVAPLFSFMEHQLNRIAIEMLCHRYPSCCIKKSAVTEKEFHDELDKLLEGFPVVSYGLTWALKNSSSISKLVIMNSPLTASSPVPGLFQQLRIPLLGEFTSQNAVMAERFIEAGSAYVLKLEKADVYRLPYLSSSGPGFALLEAARRINFKEVSTQIATGFASGRWDEPTLVAWGISDKYLRQSVAEEFKQSNPSVIKLKLMLAQAVKTFI